RRIVITKKLMLLLGYYLAEGHLTKTIHQIGFSFNRNESKYINECISLLKEITSKKIFLRHPNKNSTQVLIHSKEWYYFFKKACGRGAKNKHIPSFLWKISKECFEELLLGYLRGDGYKLGEYSITAKSVSHQLIKELVWICQFHGISCSINEEQSKEHILPQGTLFKGSHVYSINIPKSELNNTEFFRKRNKYSPHPRSKLFPIDGLRKVYYQIKPKMFNHHRAEQMTLKKKSANFNRIKKVLDWFDNCKSVEYSSESKEIIKNYRNLFHNDIMTLTINKVTLDKECDVYDLSVDKTERFFGGCYPILLHNSGNKGFHIGVPFEAFPQEVAGKKTKDMFPDYPKKISLYLLDLISNNYIMIKDNKVLFDNKYAFGLNELKNKFGEREFLLTTCLRCKQKIKLSQENTNEFICSRCEQRIKGENEFMKCTKCAILMEKIEQKKTLCPCGSNEYNSVFNPLSIIEVDSILISSRHLYRMPYSLHEKSALVSLPIDPDKVMEFEKEMAHPDKVLTSMFTFLDRNVSGESGRRLLMQALDFEVKLEEEREIEKDYEQFQVESPITEEFFPPCIKKILEGVEDGRKRSVFILMNFLGKIGWSKNEIEVYLQQWNKEKNRESLREVYIKGQMNHFKPGDKLPPNCNNEAYYMDLGMCLPDGLCQKIRNPVNYTIVRWKSHLRDKEK
ncbi:MAG: hypothetical protein KKH52_03155, partial [Nanoarchaeota archaeon]|nr:hypothetical protein [Nanoarchaeota archaeon]